MISQAFVRLLVQKSFDCLVRAQSVDLFGLDLILLTLVDFCAEQGSSAVGKQQDLHNTEQAEPVQASIWYIWARVFVGCHHMPFGC